MIPNGIKMLMLSSMAESMSILLVFPLCITTRECVFKTKNIDELGRKVNDCLESVRILRPYKKPLVTASTVIWTSFL